MSRSIDWKDRHLWQIQPVRDVLFALAILGLIVLGGMLSLLTVPLLLALLLAYLFDPIATRLTHAGGQKWLSRTVATGFIIATAIVLVVLPILFGFAYGLVQVVELLGTIGDKASILQTALAGKPEAAGRAQEQIQANDDFWKFVYDRVHASEENDFFNTLVTDATAWVSENKSELGHRAVETITGAIEVVLSFVTSVGTLVFQAFLTTFFFFFISINYRRVIDFFEELIPTKNRDRTVQLVQEFDRVIAAFVRGRLTIAAFQSVFFSIGYAVVGVPAAVLLGIATGIIAIVPYLALISMPIAILLMYLDPPGGFRANWWWMVGGPIVVYQAGQLIDDYVLTPMIQGKQTNLDTPTVVFASIAGGVLAGIYGVLLAIPVAACLKILIREVLWPKINDWIEGRAKDPLPISQSNNSDSNGESTKE